MLKRKLTLGLAATFLFLQTATMTNASVIGNSSSLSNNNNTIEAVTQESSKILPDANIYKDGPFTVAVDQNAGPNRKGIVVRPASLQSLGVKKHPIFIWGPGSGGQPTGELGLLRRLASHGFVVYCEQSATSGSQARGGLDWIVAQSNNSKSPYYNKLDTDRIGAGGYSLGSVGAFVVADDSRIKTTIHVDGGSFDGKGTNKMHAPTLFICGLADNLALGNTEKDYNNVKVPVFFGGIIGGGHGSGPAEDTVPITSWLRWHLAGRNSAKK